MVAQPLHTQRLALIEHPEHVPLIIIRPHYLDILGGERRTQDVVAGAALLGVFEFWTALRKRKAEQDSRPRPGWEWIVKSLQQLSDTLLGMFGTKTLRAALKLLAEQGLISIRENAMLKVDRKHQYRLEVSAVRAAIERWIANRQATEGVTAHLAFSPTDKSKLPNGEAELPSESAKVPTEPAKSAESDLRESSLETPFQDQIQEDSAASAALPTNLPQQEDNLTQEQKLPTEGDLPTSSNTPLTPPSSGQPSTAPTWNVGDAVYYIYASGVLHTVVAVVIGLTKQKVKIATREKDRTRAVVWPANLQSRRRDGEPEAWEIEALAAEPTRTTPAALPQSALTKAMFEAIPEDIRPTSCHYGKSDTAAKAVMQAGWTAEQVALFTEWLYATNEWYRRGNDGTPVIITMHAVDQKIKGCWPMVEKWATRRKTAATPQTEQIGKKDVNPFEFANQRFREIERRNLERINREKKP